MRFDFSKLAPPPAPRPRRRKRVKKARRAPAPDRLLGAVPVKEGSELRAILHDFEGAPMLNLRLWILKKGDGEGLWIPTRAGFTVKAAIIPALVGALSGNEGAGGSEHFRTPEKARARVKDTCGGDGADSDQTPTHQELAIRELARRAQGIMPGITAGEVKEALGDTLKSIKAVEDCGKRFRRQGRGRALGGANVG